MDEKYEMYEIYRHMFTKAQELEKKIQSQSKYSTVFISVGDEKKGFYFVDIEAGSSETYFHYRGLLTEKQILKNFY